MNKIWCVYIIIALLAASVSGCNIKSQDSFSSLLDKARQGDAYLKLADTLKLRSIASRVPLAYSLLDDAYYKPDKKETTTNCKPSSIIWKLKSMVCWENMDLCDTAVHFSCYLQSVTRPQQMFHIAVGLLFHRVTLGVFGGYLARWIFPCYLRYSAVSLRRLFLALTCFCQASSRLPHWYWCIPMSNPMLSA